MRIVKPKERFANGGREQYIIPGIRNCYEHCTAHSKET